MSGHNIGIVGATGAVGLKILKVLDERLKEIGRASCRERVSVVV